MKLLIMLTLISVANASEVTAIVKPFNVNQVTVNIMTPKVSENEDRLSYCARKYIGVIDSDEREELIRQCIKG